MRKISAFNCIFCIYVLRSSDDILPTFEGLQVSEDELFFSFDKESFDNLKCNISEKVLNHESLFKSPFGFTEPLGNFIKTFCLFYQHSQVKNDKIFEVILKNLFDCFCQGINDSDNTELTFETYMNKQDKRIKKILEEKNISDQLVKVEEKEGRIICTYNNLYNKEHSEFIFYRMQTTKDTIEFLAMQFFEAFNILFLEGLLEPGYFSSLEKLNGEYVKEKIDLESLPEKNHYSEVISRYNLLDKVLRKKYEYLGIMNEENYCENFCKEYLKNSFIVDTYCFPRRNLRSNDCESNNFLKGKVTVKIFNDIRCNLETFCSYPVLYKEALLIFKKHVKTFFEGTNLSDKSILSLTVQCIEFEV